MTTFFNYNKQTNKQKFDKQQNKQNNNNTINQQ